MTKLTRNLIASVWLVSAPLLLSAEESDNKTTASEEEIAALLEADPKDIKAYKSIKRRLEQAIHDRALPDNPVLRSLKISLRPGSKAPVFYIGAGFGAAIEVVDATGKPWPIADFTLGDPKMYNVQLPNVGDLNVLTVTPLQYGGASNIILLLKGRSTPVSLYLKTTDDPKQYTDRVTLVIEGRGPKAVVPVVQKLQLPEENPLLTEILDGIPPKNAVRLKTSDDQVAAWRVGDKLYVRTVRTVIAPWPNYLVPGAGGVKAYELDNTGAITVLKEETGTLETVTLDQGGAE